MKVMPPPGPERRRALVVLTITFVALAYFMWRQFGPAPTDAAGATSNSKTPETIAALKNSALPEPLNLPSLEPVPEEPKASRNPFRFGVPPAPPAPPPRPAPPVLVMPPTSQVAQPVPPP